MSENYNYKKPTEWQNFGDISPKRHGGIFVKWEKDMWHIIETYHPNVIPNEISEDQFRFEHYWLEEMDIWQNGKPENGFTENMLKGLDEFSSLPFDIMSKEELPESESYQDYVNWYIENHFVRLLGHIVHIQTENHPYEVNYSQDYWDYLSDYGINPDNF